MEAIETLKQSASSVSTNDTKSHDIPKIIQKYKNVDQESRSSITSPTGTPLSYDALESGRLYDSSWPSRLRNGMTGLGGISTTVPSASLVCFITKYSPIKENIH